MQFLVALLSIIVFLIFSLVLPQIKHRISLRRASKRRNCASPPRLASSDPIFGIDTVLTDLRYRKEKRRIKEWYAAYQRLGKTFELYPFGRRVIATVDPRNVQFVLSTDFEKFGVGPARQRATLPMLGQGIVSDDGERWRKGRDNIMPTFTRSQIADREMFDKHVQRFLEHLPSDGRIVDLQPLFDQLILDASSEFIFGESLDTLLGDKCPPDAEEFINAFNYSQKIVGLRVPLGRMDFMIRDPKFWQSCTLIQKFTQRHVDRALQRAKEETLDTEEKPKKYVLVHELAKESSDSEALCDQLLNVFFAGRDTPAVALSNIFFSIARHPSVWVKIRDEAEGLQAEDLSFEKLKSLRYTQYAINEALRLYPAVPNLARGCLAETALPYGGGSDGTQPVVVIPGDTIQWSIFSMHRDPSVFGDDVESFQPERWADIRPGWSFLPFGGGARHCPAQQLALFWVSYTIVRMALEFAEVRNRDPVKAYVEHLKLNLESANGVKVALVRN